MTPFYFEWQLHIDAGWHNCQQFSFLSAKLINVDWRYSCVEMKIFTSDLQAYGFLTHLINSKLVAYSKHTSLTPENILALNLSDSARELLRNTYPSAQIKNIDSNSIKNTTHIAANNSVDLLIANLTAANDEELIQTLHLASQVLKRDDLIVFATWDHANKAFLQKHSKSLINKKIIDEIKVMDELDEMEALYFVSHRERIFHAHGSDEEIACHIFVGHTEGESELENVFDPEEVEDQFEVNSIDEEITEISEIILEEDDNVDEIDLADDSEESLEKEAADVVEDDLIREDDVEQKIENEAEDAELSTEETILEDQVEMEEIEPDHVVEEGIEEVNEQELISEEVNIEEDLEDNLRVESEPLLEDEEISEQEEENEADQEEENEMDQDEDNEVETEEDEELDDDEENDADPDDDNEAEEDEDLDEESSEPDNLSDEENDTEGDADFDSSDQEEDQDLEDETEQDVDGESDQELATEQEEEKAEKIDAEDVIEVDENTEIDEGPIRPFSR